MSTRDQFIKLCDGAEKLDEANGYADCSILEPFYREMIKLGEDLEPKSEFIACLIEVVNGKIAVPATMLPYVVRHFKFPEVLNASILRLGDPPDPGYMNFHSDIVHAIEDEQWEDADFWEHMK